MAQKRATSPMAIFRKAHERAEYFLSGGIGGKGKRAFDDRRAAIVFAVAAIDAYFHAKIIDVLRKKRRSEEFFWPDSVQKVLRKTTAIKLGN